MERCDVGAEVVIYGPEVVTMEDSGQARCKLS